MTLQKLIELGELDNFIQEKGKLAYAIVKKRFPRLESNPGAMTVNDIVSEAIITVLERYPDKEVEEISKLLMVITVNKALNYLKKGNQSKEITYVGFIHEDKISTYNEVEKVLAMSDLVTMVSQSGLNERQQFIIFKYLDLEYEKGFEQKEVVAKIEKEYITRFNCSLSLDNYRQIKKRSLDVLKAVL